MYIHPLEALGYYCILYSPSAALPMRPATFFVYMALLGFAGVLDHSGIRVAIPGVRACVRETETVGEQTMRMCGVFWR